MTPFTIAHLSDFHISADYQRSHIRRTRRALEYVHSLGVDHIIVTGDITANGTSADFRIARSLLASMGVLDTRRLTVVPGNHDVFGGVHTAEDVLTFPKQCKMTDQVARLQHFSSAFHETFERTLHHSEKRPFPFAKVLGDVVVIGVNTVAPYSRVRNPLGSNGDVDDGSFESLVELLYSPLFKGKRKVVALHHHFHKMREVRAGAMHSVWGRIEKHTMKLRGKSRLLKLFATTGVDLVVHGHVHESFEYTRDGVRCLNAGGSIAHDNSEDLHVNIVRLDGEECKAEIHSIPPRESVHLIRAGRSPLKPSDPLRHEAA
jgi:3',5'-cyclic AMP phosphodiesterase CpdA